MIIKASSRSGYRNLANHLMNSQDNDHVTLHQIRGLAGSSLHAALAEVDAVSQGTRCQKPLFSVSFNPPEHEQVTDAQFEKAFAKLEHKLGLVDQPRAVVFHEKEGRRHCHVVYSRIDTNEMKAISMDHFKLKCTDVSREIFIENGWQLPKGLENKKERDPFQLSNAEWQRLKRMGIEPQDIKSLVQDAWKVSDNQASFKHALEERGLFLAKGDRRPFVIMDAAENIHSLTKNGGLSSQEIKKKLGKPDQLASVAMTAIRIRSIYNAEMMKKVKALKTKHLEQKQKLEEEKIIMVGFQRQARKDLQESHKLKRNSTVKIVRDRFKKGIVGLFDKVTGKEKRLRLIGKKQMGNLKARHNTTRQQLIFEHNLERAQLQKRINALKEAQREERKELAKNILHVRTHNQKQTEGGLSQKFEDTNLERTRERTRKRSRAMESATNHDSSSDNSNKSERSRKRSRNRSLTR